MEEKRYMPVNKNAMPEVVQLLDFLYSIQGKYTLTGIHNFASDINRYDQVVDSLTGKTPVIWGSDFSFNALGENQCDFRHCGPLNLTVPGNRTVPCEVLNLSTTQQRQLIVDAAIKKYHEGRIITLMWHCCWPTNGDDCNGDDIWRWADNLPSQEEWDELTTDGTELNNLWKKQMDGIAVYLKQLQAAGVPVLWRPFHEMNGVWFWWCNKPGENGFKKLWISMYNYLTDYHKLNNLLWVWNTNAPRNNPGDEAGPYADYYPGSDYVDVLAADVYHADWKQSHHDELVALGKGKIISLGEVGALPSTEVYENQPQWSWFMPWGYFILNSDNVKIAKDIYNHPRSVNLDMIDFSDQTYKLKK
ncbi:glycoside hydrolase family 26 protein [Bacteroides oleiciplenus]|nr:glycosyl hydrolase [Bacteroides oleiciplenus]